MNYEKLTKKELIERAKRAEEIIKDALEIAESINFTQPHSDKKFPSKVGQITGTLQYYVQYKLMEGKNDRNI